MSSENGLFQHYFTNHRRTPSRQRLGILSAIWGRASSRSSRKSIKSIADSVPSTRLEEMETPLTTNGNGDIPADTAPVVTFDADIFRSYLLALLPPVIGALPEELESLFDDEFDERVARFAADSGGPLYVVKTKEESSTEGVFLEQTIKSGLNRYFRRTTTNVPVPLNPTSHVPPIERNHTRVDQAWRDSRPSDPTCVSATFLELIWGG